MSDSKAAARRRFGAKTIAIATGLVGAVAAAVGVAGASVTSCAASPTNTPVQSFEQPKNLDIVCLQVLKLDGSGNPQIPAIPQPESACAQVPVGVIGSTLPYHLFALVTQTTRGEVAVVDLTAGYVIDIDPNTPGTNLLPVGRLPSDIATTPDGRMAFVGSGDPNAPAIFALPTTVILGNSQVFDGGALGSDSHAIVPKLTTWPVCSLPQVPGAIRVLQYPTGTTVDNVGYAIVAVLPGDTTTTAKVVTIDPAPLLRGAQSLEDSGLPDGDVVAPGSLTPCSYIDEAPLTLSAIDPQSLPKTEGPTWSDGLGYDAGVVDADMPNVAVACGAPSDAGGNAPRFTNLQPIGAATVLDRSGPRPLLYVADAALPIIHVIDLSVPSAPVELAPLVATSAADPSRVVSIGQIAISPTTRNYQRFLYAVDRTEGSILIYDVTDPATSPHVPLTRPHQELDPFRPPDRILFASPVASVAFVQHDWPLLQRYDSAGDLTSLTAAETGLLCNPNPTANDSVAKVTPEQGPFYDDGAYYRNMIGLQEDPLGPARLRGVFAFATLTTGSVVTIDVDDWDAPCRRPDPLAPHFTADAGALQDEVSNLMVYGPFSSIAPPQPSSGPGNFDAYGAPVAYVTTYTDSPVTYEWFYPISAPHRPRSAFILRNDAINGQHAPYLLSTPQLYTLGSPEPTQGPQAVPFPSMVPTDSPFVDPALVGNPSEPNPLARVPYFAVPVADGGGIATWPDGGAVTPAYLQTIPQSTPGVRFAYEDPEVQTDQDWTVTYEGPLPGFFDGSGNPLVLANVLPYENFAGALLSNTNALFCSKGIEDLSLGEERANAETTAMTALGLGNTDSDGGANDYNHWAANYSRQVADYVQLTDNIVPDTDPYWTVDNSCWSAVPSDLQSTGPDRYNTCAATFGETLDPTTPNLQRDFPIIEAYNDRLLVGRFAYQGNIASRPAGSPDWTVVGPDPTNVPVMKLLQCCFHNQVHFNVRAGGQWVATGSASGFLHHIVATGSNARCAPSCEERNALLNGRAPPVLRQPPVFSGDGGVTAADLACAVTTPSITRDSVLALRNPMFSFMIWDGQDPAQLCADQPPKRDMLWAFSTRGGFQPQTLNLAATTAGLSPQSMRFIDSLGQLAIVDGSTQGLILIDLNTIGEAHPPYY